MQPEAPNGTVLTYQGVFFQPSFGRQLLGQTKQEIVAEISRRCTESGIIVRSQKQLAATTSTFQMELILQVDNGTGFAKLSDVASIVANGAYRATEKMPISYSIPRVQLPNKSTTTSTGQPDATPKPDPNKEKSWWESFTSWIETLGTGALLGGVGVSVFLILGLGLLFFTSGKLPSLPAAKK